MLISKFHSVLQQIPKVLFCAGCRNPAWVTVCNECKDSRYPNSSILASPVHEIEGVAPLLYSFERTQTLIRRWKEHGGTDLRKHLFRMPEPLRHELLQNHFFAIVPIPQSQKRSYVRGHDSALEVARFFSLKLDLPILTLLELKDEKTKRLTGLSRFEREFAENPFRITHEFPRNDSLSKKLGEAVDQGRETRLLLIDDLITSGSTISKAAETLQSLLPRSKIWAGSLGFRPNLKNRMALMIVNVF